jgi:hypothetical protein
MTDWRAGSKAHWMKSSSRSNVPTAPKVFFPLPCPSRISNPHNTRMRPKYFPSQCPKHFANVHVLPRSATLRMHACSQCRKYFPPQCLKYFFHFHVLPRSAILRTPAAQYTHQPPNKHFTAATEDRLGGILLEGARRVVLTLCLLHDSNIPLHRQFWSACTIPCLSHM